MVIPLSKAKEHDTAVSPIYVLWLEYAITQKLAISLYYQCVSHIGNKNLLSVHPDDRMLSISVTYQF